MPLIKSHLTGSSYWYMRDTKLRYFNMKKPVKILVDASGKGLGATYILDDGLVTFASKALTPQ